MAWLPGPSRATHFRSHYFVSDAPRSLIEFQKPARDTDDGVENVMQTNHVQIKKQRLRNQSANRRRPQVSAVNLKRPCCCSDPLYLLQLPYMKHIRPARALNSFENYVARTSLLLNNCHKPAGCLPCACCRSCCFCLTISQWCFCRPETPCMHMCQSCGSCMSCCELSAASSSTCTSKQISCMLR